MYKLCIVIEVLGDDHHFNNAFTQNSIKKKLPAFKEAGQN